MTNKRHTEKCIKIGLHTLVWLLVLAMPFLTFQPNQAFTFDQYFRSLAYPFFFAIVFYANHFYFIPKLLSSKKLFMFCIANIIIYAASIAVMDLTRDFTRRKPPQFQVDAGRPSPPLRGQGPRGDGPPLTGMIVRSVIAFMMTTGVAVAIHATTQWFKSEDLRKDLEREHLKSELDNLKNQLNPHFFFNTLNNIYGLIVQNQTLAQTAVHQLSKLMRYLLYDSNEKFVPLSKEIEFIHHYIDLMRLRVTSNVRVSYSFADGSSGEIAPLIFISLIENSFKHGISADKPSVIEMFLTIDPEKELTFRIRNTSFPKKDNDRSGSGIGLENLKKRLALLYPGRHSLDIRADEKDYEATLKLQL